MVRTSARSRLRKARARRFARAQYFKAGLANNELCIWVPSQVLEKDEAEVLLRRAAPRYEVHALAGPSEFHDYRVWYLRGGIFPFRRAGPVAPERARRNRARRVPPLSPPLSIGFAYGPLRAAGARRRVNLGHRGTGVPPDRAAHSRGATRISGAERLVQPHARMLRREIAAACLYNRREKSIGQGEQ